MGQRSMNAYTLFAGQGERVNRRRTVRNIGLLTFAVASILTVFWFWDLGSLASLPAHLKLFEDNDDDVCTFDRSPTRYLGGVPGYQVFENVAYYNRTFYLFGNTSSLPEKDQFLSFIDLRTADDLGEDWKPELCWEGTSLLTNEGANTKLWNGLQHYYHFAIENLLGGFAAGTLATPRPAVPKRIVVPWAPHHDRWSMNDVVVRAVFGDNLIDKARWDLLDGTPIFFQKIIFVDRWVAHHGHDSKLVNLWVKMPMNLFQVLAAKPNFSHFFDSARDKLHKYFEVPESNKLRFAYIDRQATNRKLPNLEHAQLLNGMRELAERNGVVFDHLILEALPPEQQFHRVSQANVLVGIHGNGLTHLLWMPKGSAVIEMFPEDVFQRDYQTAAAILGFDYTAIAGKHEITPAMWESHPGNQNGPKLHNGTPVDANIPLVLRRLEDFIDARLSQKSARSSRE